jgi:hypothetical protein
MRYLLLAQPESSRMLDEMLALCIVSQQSLFNNEQFFFTPVFLIPGCRYQSSYCRVCRNISSHV